VASEAHARIFFFLDPTRAQTRHGFQKLRQAANIRFGADQNGAFAPPRTSQSL
jgi:hypothetical protein